ncbi:MAG: ABC-type transport system permease component LolE [Candidatus Nomurabacteria bacterium GW2011_GWA1_37_20]|uniref:ABC-type transport system permease component LolE n=2 Tax=Parcubacteria group TaxID=1794811 RepID=A0A0G0IA64_9BACT|nr:MAG: ABC-type transport system permease component LolE [Parcubacteria group bacterium GW2011_GWB1_37_13]KKQ33813.1 MAG: ABC-type transport system permease component LolE [Candidatus Nomurabacteria bacterium GW2011_GWA1_37_20]KKQ47885.1 MAG: ABC-type transport system permease component LolE [Candidatus Yanofskybacteria bacterium GW2011_GWC2_37_9]
MFSLLNIRIGFFLAKRQIRRSSRWTTTLIIFVMFFTFLNLVVVSGILVGLIQGAIDAVRTHYTSDVIISTLSNKTYVENSPEIISIVKSLPQVEAVTARYLEGGTVEANYKTRTDEKEKPNTATASITGIDPVAEDSVSGISKFIIEGEYLTPQDYDQVLVGSFLVEKYLPIDSPGFSTLRNVSPGTKIRIKVHGVEREVTVKGIIKAKVDEVSLRLFMIDSQLKSIIGRNDYNVDEISIKLKPGVDPSIVRDILKRNGVDRVAKVQTYTDAQPKFIKDMVNTFALLGNMLSSIGLVVASITIFIVIFINAITRRKFIGILKGIGINERTIEISYIFQSFFYAFCGSLIGIVTLYVFLQPAIAAHPIDFPFSDGILVAPIGGTMLRVGLLMITTIIAGFIPARMIVRKNTLDSILGRN